MRKARFIPLGCLESTETELIRFIPYHNRVYQSEGLHEQNLPRTVFVPARAE